MFLLFLPFYEASDHRMSGEAIDEIIASKDVKELENAWGNEGKECITLRKTPYRRH